MFDKINDQDLRCIRQYLCLNYEGNIQEMSLIYKMTNSYNKCLGIEVQGQKVGVGHHWTSLPLISCKVLNLQSYINIVHVHTL